MLRQLTITSEQIDAYVPCSGVVGIISLAAVFVGGRYAISRPRILHDVLGDDSSRLRVIAGSLGRRAATVRSRTGRLRGLAGFVQCGGWEMACLPEPPLTSG